MSLGTRHNINYWHVLPVPFAIPISGSWQHFHRAQRNSHRFASRNSAEITMYTVRKAFQQQRRLMCVQSPGCAWWHDLPAVGFLWVLSSHCHMAPVRRTQVPTSLCRPDGPHLTWVWGVWGGQLQWWFWFLTDNQLPPGSSSQQHSLYLLFL